MEWPKSKTPTSHSVKAYRDETTWSPELPHYLFLQKPTSGITLGENGDHFQKGYSTINTGTKGKEIKKIKIFRFRSDSPHNTCEFSTRSWEISIPTNGVPLQNLNFTSSLKKFLGPTSQWILFDGDEISSSTNLSHLQVPIPDLVTSTFTPHSMPIRAGCNAIARAQIPVTSSHSFPWIQTNRGKWQWRRIIT